jgi:hypothetical protein
MKTMDVLKVKPDFCAYTRDCDKITLLPSAASFLSLFNAAKAFLKSHLPGPTHPSLVCLVKA